MSDSRLLESLECCIWDTAARAAGNAHPRPSDLNKNEPGEYASVESLESLWEDDDGQEERPNDYCELRRAESKLDRSDYRKWIGATGLHIR